MMSYAGVPLSEPSGTEIGEWISDVIRPDQVFPIAYQSWTGYITNGPLLNVTPDVSRPIKIGSFFWPWGASRFARGHFVVTSSQIDAIRRRTYRSGASVAATFQFSDGDNSIATDLWMLPCIPLARAVNGLEMFLLTVVDDRYWWLGTQVTSIVESGHTTWNELYSAVATALGVSVNVDPIPSAYGLPTTDYSAKSLPAPQYLDTVAFSVGQRIVRSLDGVVTAQNVATARAIVTANQSSGLPAFAGGEYDFNPRG